MRIVLMTLYKQALRRASRAMFNARLIALAIDVDLPHCDAPRAARDAGNRKDVAAATRASGKARATGSV
jgi:hypothetical protein